MLDVLHGLELLGSRGHLPLATCRWKCSNDFSWSKSDRMWVIGIAPVARLFPQHQFSSSTSIDPHHFNSSAASIELFAALQSFRVFSLDGDGDGDGVNFPGGETTCQVSGCHRN